MATMEGLVCNPLQDESIILPNGEFKYDDVAGMTTIDSDPQLPPISPPRNNGDKQTLARKLRGVGRKVIRLSVLPKKAFKRGKHKGDTDGDELSTATSLESFTIEIDSDNNQVNLLQSSAFSSTLAEPNIITKTTPSQGDGYASPSSVDNTLKSLEKYVLQEVVNSLDTMAISDDLEEKEEEKEEEERDDLSVEIEVKGPDIPVVVKKEQASPTKTTTAVGENDIPQYTSLVVEKTTNATTSLDLSDVDDDLNDATVLSMGRHQAADKNRQNGKAVNFAGIKDFVSFQAAPFLMKFTCGAMECPSCDGKANGAPQNKTTMSQKEAPLLKTVISRAASEPKPLAWLGSPADDDDEEEDDGDDDGKESGLIPVDTNAKAEDELVENSLVLPSTFPEVSPSKSFHSSFQEQESATAEPSVVVSLEKKREDMARMQWHKQFLHQSVQRMLEEKQKQAIANMGMDVLVTEEEKKEETRDVLLTHSLFPPSELMIEGAMFHATNEEEKVGWNVQDEGQEEKQADGIVWNDDGFHDDFDEFHFEANFPNIEVESIQFEEEKKVERTEEIKKSPTLRLKTGQKTPLKTHDVERLLTPIDGKTPSVEGKREDGHLGDADSCLLGEEILEETTLAGEVSIGYIVRDLDKLQDFAAARSNPPPPPPTPPSAVSKSRTFGFPPLYPPPPPPTPPSPARHEQMQPPQNQCSAEKERTLVDESKEDPQLLPPQNKILAEFAMLVQKHSGSGSSFLEQDAREGEDSNPKALDQPSAVEEEKEEHSNVASLLAMSGKPRIPSFSMFDEGSVCSEEEENGDEEEADKLEKPCTDGAGVQESSNAKPEEKVRKFTEQDSIFDGTDDIPMGTIAVERKPPIEPVYTYDLVDTSGDKKPFDELPCNEIIVDRSFSSRIKGGSEKKKRVAFDLSDDLKSTVSMTTAGYSTASFNNEDIFYGCVGGVDVTKAIINELDRYIDSIDDEVTLDEESEYSLGL